MDKTACAINGEISCNPQFSDGRGEAVARNSKILHLQSAA